MSVCCCQVEEEFWEEEFIEACFEEMLEEEEAQRLLMEEEIHAYEELLKNIENRNISNFLDNVVSWFYSRISFLPVHSFNR